MMFDEKYFSKMWFGMWHQLQWKMFANMKKLKNNPHTRIYVFGFFENIYFAPQFELVKSLDFFALFLRL